MTSCLAADRRQLLCVYFLGTFIKKLQNQYLMTSKIIQENYSRQHQFTRNCLTRKLTFTICDFQLLSVYSCLSEYVVEVCTNIIFWIHSFVTCRLKANPHLLRKRNFFFKILAEMYLLNHLHYFMEMLLQYQQSQFVSK